MAVMAEVNRGVEEAERPDVGQDISEKNLRGMLRYDTGMNLELSDKYERMDKCFRDKVQKTHFDIINLMEMYQMFKINPTSHEVKNKPIARLVMRDQTLFPK